MYGLNEFGNFSENEYEMGDEPILATLFTTGNGYMGIRGSFEEFGSLRIQGAFVRGFIDEITEVIEPFCENEYLKKYYIDEQKLKEFQKQESCVNMPDFLLVKIIIDGKIFYPWQGKIIQWKREIDSSKAIYTRKVLFEDENGNKTAIDFERFASFSNDHLYCQKITIKPINHDKQIFVISGVDTFVKTGGQKITETEEIEINEKNIYYQFHAINKFNFKAGYMITHSLPQGKIEKYSENGIEGIKVSLKKSKEYVIEKITSVVTSRDTNKEIKNFAKQQLDRNISYENLKEKHIVAYNDFFDVMDIKISGDETSDGYLRFASYHTAISVERKDYVHGISAKGLTGERYNQFVWWDSEIYQLPYFIYTAPETAKNLLMYRYKMLKQSEKNALLDGKKGAKFAFCSSVTGEEKVWIYARHPFMQVHINSDIPYGVINYFYSTHDKDFLINYGLELIYKCLLYWTERITKVNGRYEILQVTGTDEHHPYVDNDAYTNYSVNYIFKHFLKLSSKYNYKISIEEEKLFNDIEKNIYLPSTISGLIPQFDRYFNLSRRLESQGKGTLKQFQMKTSGLYNKSQVIKQPDVILLYTYMNIITNNSKYSINWDYYEQMCESSSSLAFPVHAIASADNNRILSFYNYFQKTLKIDIDDIHGVAWQGVHSGCLAGGYMSILRGIFGVKMFDEYVSIEPKQMPLWKGISAKFVYQGNIISISEQENKICIKLLKGSNVKIKYFNQEKLLENQLNLTI